jgi:hypothetical protein
MEKSKNQYGRNFREAIAHIQKLPASERSAASNRKGAGAASPKPAPRPKTAN